MPAHSDDVGADELASAPGFHGAVDRHSGSGQDGLGVGTTVDQVSQLEQLTEPDHVTGDSYLFHATSRQSGDAAVAKPRSR